MSASPVFTVHRRRLDAEDDLEQSLGLKEGQRLFVVSSDGQDILLRRSPDNVGLHPITKPNWQLAWEEFHTIYTPAVPWTPEWQEVAERRRDAAKKTLERAYADPASGATEIKGAERELELALDDLMGGPYPER